MNTNKKWSRKFERCIECNTSKFKHKGSGLCVRCFDKRRYKTNPKVKGYRDKYTKNNRDKIRESQRKWYLKVREEMFQVLGNECIKCGFSDRRALQIDHINGGGIKERRKGNTRRFHSKVLKSVKKGDKKYQLLCANCNWIKRFERKEWGGAPRKHQ